MENKQKSWGRDNSGSNPRKNKTKIASEEKPKRVIDYQRDLTEDQKLIMWIYRDLTSFELAQRSNSRKILPLITWICVLGAVNLIVSIITILTIIYK